MSMKQLTLPGTTVKKSNELVRSKIIISNTLASRILATLIACVHKGDTEFKELYSIKIKDLIVDESGRGYANIKKTCKDLLSAHVEFETPDPKGKEPDLRLIPFFVEIKYKNGIIAAQFNKNLSPVLLQLGTLFTQYNLLEYLTLPSVYSQRVFEILKSWNGLPEVTIRLNELHFMLDTPESLQSNFKDFRRRVLEQAHKDINNRTELTFEWEAIKTGRAVTAIRFIFAKNRSLELQNKKMIINQQKQSDKNNENFIKALACSKSMNPCVPKKNTVCDVCQRVGLNL
jgi:plasmid replication initiation protein